MKQFHKVLLMGLLLGTSFPVSKLAIGALGVWPFRMISSASALLGLAIVLRKDLLAFVHGRVDRRALAMLALLGVPNIFLVPTLNNYALSQTTSSNALILVYVMPAMLSLMQMVAQRRVRADALFAALLSLCAIGLLLDAVAFGVGEMLILISAAVWAAGTFWAGRMALQFAPAVTTVVQYLSSLMLVSLCYALAPANTATVDAPALVPVLLAVYVGVVANALVFHLWFGLIRDRGAEYAAYASLISPLVGILASLLLLHETVSATMLVALLLMLASVYLIQCRPPAPTCKAA